VTLLTLAVKMKSQQKRVKKIIYLGEENLQETLEKEKIQEHYLYLMTKYKKELCKDKDCNTFCPKYHVDEKGNSKDKFSCETDEFVKKGYSYKDFKTKDCKKENCKTPNCFFKHADEDPVEVSTRNLAKNIYKNNSFILLVFRIDPEVKDEEIKKKFKRYDFISINFEKDKVGNKKCEIEFKDYDNAKKFKKENHKTKIGKKKIIVLFKVLNFKEKNIIKQIKIEYKKNPNVTKNKGILLIGNTGVGKSSLCNLILESKNMKIGGYTSTTLNKDIIKNFEIEKYKVKDLPLYVFDSQGLEKGKNEDEMLQDILKLVRKIEEYQKIHYVFYIISGDSCRFDKSDSNMIEKLESISKYGLNIVITKSDHIPKPKEIFFKNMIKNKFNLKNKVYFVSNTNIKNIKNYPGVCPKKNKECFDSEPTKLKNNLYQCNCGNQFSICKCKENNSNIFYNDKYDFWNCTGCGETFENLVVSSKHLNLINDCFSKSYFQKASNLEVTKKHKNKLFERLEKEKKEFDLKNDEKLEKEEFLKKLEKEKKDLKLKNEEYLKKLENEEFLKKLKNEEFRKRLEKEKKDLDLKWEIISKKELEIKNAESKRKKASGCTIL
jgi:energy-coupling factor transporter ATP-binding protein EcfA2